MFKGLLHSLINLNKYGFSKNKTISIKLPIEVIEALDEMVRLEIFASRSEAIRVAARDLLQKIIFNLEETIQVPDQKAGMMEDELNILDSLTIS